MKLDKEELKQQIDIASWDLLRAHLERGGIIIVNNNLDLSEVAFSIASDKKEIVERWLANSLIAKPTSDQIQSWDSVRFSKIFSTIIISPFILIQEVT